MGRVVLALLLLGLPCSAQVLTRNELILTRASAPLLSANPDLLMSTANDFGPWGAPEFLYSFTNDYGPVGSPDFLQGVSNDYGIGLQIRFTESVFVPLDLQLPRIEP